ncbi:MAG: hypothetical protein CML66_25835 [Rhodobacteraceae bacterium]|nr:hypothetical protein [Paracoccaceae bacterium]MAY44655.1 hypothetical protein [Paracoccaceae bacterium]|tara:strand:- start:160 stop:501 length:342 start_codon:yes stop_codon:yes gene_type:complete
MADATLLLEVTSSSSGEIYGISFVRAGDNLICKCSCPAGKNGQVCKHRLNILQGNIDDVTGGQIERIDLVPSIVSGTDVERALVAYLSIDEELAAVKKRVSAAKKALSKAMLD